MLRGRRFVAPCTVIAATAFLVSGCNAKTFARDQFGSRYTCPDERITTTLRKDLSAVDLAFRPEPPPRDVAADPGRLELWKEKQARGAEEWDGKSVVQVRGCGHEVFFICGQLRVSVGATRYGCRDASYPPGGGTH